MWPAQFPVPAIGLKKPVACGDGGVAIQHQPSALADERLVIVE